MRRELGLKQRALIEEGEMEVSEGGREKDAAKAKATVKGPPLLHYCICSVPGPPLAGSTLCSVGALPNSMQKPS